MSNPLTGAQRRALHARRLKWLTDRPALLAMLPGINDDVNEEQSRMLQIVCESWRQEGLHSRGVKYEDAKWGMRRIISEANGHKVQRWGGPV